jgi:hypothetical protein
MDLFRNPVKSIPTSDEQIVRVNMESDDIQGRKSHLPAQEKSGALTISHVPNSGSTPGSK